ncbi:MAG TPA: hypothetical protein PLL78_06060 [Fimbriimonadaceae bacterium]|nr:hypothetical protein [Fimbriimonadaceae bacterium]HRJ96231.1 hypothetical protein [Fimbriimonadaceae bacterium]
MLNTIVCALTFAPAALVADNPVVCPVSGLPPRQNAPMLDYAGIRFKYCSTGCRARFEEAPKRYFGMAKNTVGTSLFDPVSHWRADTNRNMVSESDFGSVRFFFDSRENKIVFDANPRQYPGVPTKVCLTDPVTGQRLPYYDAAVSYADHMGVRYFFGSVSSQGTFLDNPAGYAAGVSQYVVTPPTFKMN